MSDTFRAMCAELLAWAEHTSSHYYKQPDVLDRARALLAQPEPPADGEVGELVELQWPASVAQGCHEAAVEAESGSPLQQLLVAAGDLLERLASPCYVLDADTGGIAVLEPSERTVLAPAAQPVAVSERPWERKGWCDEMGRCWMGHPGDLEFIPSWRLCRPEDAPSMTCSLPANALPIPPSDAN